MNFITAVTHLENTEQAIESLATAIASDRKLSNVICYYTQEYPPEQIHRALLHHFPTIPFIGCSSCQGLMTEHGFHAGPVVALMAIYDKQPCAYGTGLVELNDNIDQKQAAYRAIHQALIQAGRVGEIPNLILLHATPGFEEEFIDVIDDTFGTRVPIIGGSAADNHIQGQWSIITQDGWSQQGIALQLFFPSKTLSSGFSAGYSPTEFEGIITQVNGRFVNKIDGEPAACIYKEWIADHSGVQFENTYLFDHVTRFPIGRIAGYIKQQPYYKLSHPVRIRADGSLELFSTLREGETIYLMTGSKNQLIQRATQVVRDANALNYYRSSLLGAILIYCAGAMLRLGQDMSLVHQQLLEQMQGKPFICPFTFGEQGRFIGGENGHGNLMIASVIFYESD